MNKASIFKLSILILFAIVLVIFAVIYIYQWIFQNQWRIENRAIQRAMKETSLVRSIGTDSFALAESFTIVYGQDEEGRQMIVWVGDEEIHEQYASDGVSSQDVRQKVLEKEPTAQIIRITPGKYHQDWAWEVYYQKEGEQGKRAYYAYFRFSDGEWLETYTMTVMK